MSEGRRVPVTHGPSFLDSHAREELASHTVVLDAPGRSNATYAGVTAAGRSANGVQMWAVHLAAVVGGTRIVWTIAAEQFADAFRIGITLGGGATAKSRVQTSL